MQSGTAGLGPRLREARQRAGLSLRATAARVGISPSLLSQVETGKVQPSVSTLYAVVTSLGLSLDDILGLDADTAPPRATGSPLERGSTVLRAARAPVIEMENGVTWQGLSAAPGVDAVLATYAPRAASAVDGTQMQHAGTEHGYLIRGELTLELGARTHVLREGDSFCFDAARPHLYTNRTDDVAEGVWYIVGGTRGSFTGDTVRSAVDVLAALGRSPHKPTR